MMKSSFSPSRVLLSVGIGTSLSLLGDASMYAVLPTHAVDAGITLAAVGIILSANRWVRLLLNGPMGMLYDRWNRRPIFVTALFTGAISTAIYGVTTGFWPLFMGRLLWGLSWAGIWIGGNTIVLDIANEDNRGRWIGIYQIAFFFGAASGSVIGGTLTDLIGYHDTMLVLAGLTLIGAIFALIFLPETRGARDLAMEEIPKLNESSLPSKPQNRRQLFSATFMYGANRIVMAGILISTFGLFLLEQLGDPIRIGGRTFGVATITGVGLGAATIISMFSAPLAGTLSDKIHNRWRTAAAGVIPGITGFCLLAVGSPLAIMMGVPFIAATSGSSQGLSTTLVGETGRASKQSQRLGMLFTVGDLTGAVGPLLAYALIPILQIRGVYILGASLYVAVLLIAIWMSILTSSAKNQVGERQNTIH